VARALGRCVSAHSSPWPTYSPRCHWGVFWDGRGDLPRAAEALLLEILITPPPGTLSIQAEDRAPLSSAEVGQLFNIDS
jgi:hypothetical protein